MNTKEAIEFVKSEFDYMDYIAFKKEATFEAGIFQQKKDEVIALLQRGTRIEEELIQFLEKENPYPEDVFLSIEKEDFDKINDLLKKEMGYSIDKLFGNMGRKLYKSIIEILKEMIK